MRLSLWLAVCSLSEGETSHLPDIAILISVENYTGILEKL